MVVCRGPVSLIALCFGIALMTWSSKSTEARPEQPLAALADAMAAMSFFLVVFESVAHSPHPQT